MLVDAAAQDDVPLRRRSCAAEESLRLLEMAMKVKDTYVTLCEIAGFLLKLRLSFVFDY